jgi:hypothetical protein
MKNDEESTEAIIFWGGERGVGIQFDVSFAGGMHWQQMPIEGILHISVWPCCFVWDTGQKDLNVVMSHHIVMIGPIAYSHITG